MDRRRGAFLRLLGLLVLALASCFCTAAEARREAMPDGQVLLLVSEAHGTPLSDLFTQAFYSEFSSHGGSLHSLRIEYLDLGHATAPRTRETLVELLRRKYAGTRFAFVVVLNPAATQFVLQEGAFLAGDAPIVSLNPGQALPERPQGRLGLVGSDFDFGGSLRLALDLKPGARRVLQVAGCGPMDRTYDDQARASFSPWEGKLIFESTAGLPFPEILKRVSEAGDDTIVLYTTIFQDGAGHPFIPKEAAVRIAGISRQPVFGSYEPLMGTGVVGGSILNLSQNARQIAQMALGALRGEDPLPGDQKVVHIPNPPVPMFDWPPFQRFGLDPGRLPMGTVFLRRPPSPWVQYRPQILSVLAVLAVLALSTVSLAIQNRRRKEAEQFAVEKQKWVQVLIDEAPDAIAVYDADQGRFVDANPAAERLFGCPRGELLGTGPAPFFPAPASVAKGPESLAWIMGTALDGQGFTFQRDVLSRNGHVIPCQVQLTRLPAQGRRLVRMSYVSLSDLRRAEDELRSSQASLSALFENTADSIWSVDLQFRLLTFNRALAERIRKETGVDIAPGMLPTEFQSAEQATLWISFYERVLSEGAFRQEYTPLHGEERLELSFNPIRRDGAVVGISVFSKDVTEQRRLREQLNQSQKMEAVGQLAGGVAHDFNNALTGIMSAAELLRTDEVTRAQRLTLTDMILVAAERAGGLTKKLLAFSRKAEKTNAPVQVDAIVNDTVAILGRTLDKRIRIAVESKASATTVLGDDALLQNAFLNMGINAGHAMPDGGALIFRLEDIQLDEAYCGCSPFKLEPGPFLLVSVEDTGCGMPPEVQRRIFEPFFTTRKQGEGTGLGLSAVYGTIQDHRGAIQVYSEQGRGTVFHVYLPLATGASALPAAEAVLEHGEGTILLVDDEELIRLTGKAILERLGYTVLTAEDGEAGLARFEARKEDIRLVILDMIMPVMGGREILRIIRGTGAQVPVIICSGFSHEGELAEMRQEGAFTFLPKPFRQASLAAAVAEAIRSGGHPPSP